MFKKRKRNQDRIKPSRRKKEIFVGITLVLSFLFAKPRLRSSQSYSRDFENQTICERGLNDRDFNCFEDNDR